MADFPALPLWTDAYLADTRHLSQAEHGAYLLLIVTAWRTHDCRLPDDDRLLARYAGCDLRTWRRQKPTIMAFWDLEEGRWSQKRLMAEREYVMDLARKRAAAGSQGGHAKAAGANKIPVPKDTHLAEDKGRGEHVRANDKSLENIDSDLAKPVAPLQQNGSTHTHTHNKKDSVGSNEPTAGAAGVVVKLSPRRVTDDDVNESSDRKKTLFEFGRYVFGDKGGSIVTKFLGETRGDIMSACDLIESCRQKDDPRGYAFGILRRREVEDELYRIGEARIYAGAL